MTPARRSPQAGRRALITAVLLLAAGVWQPPCGAAPLAVSLGVFDVGGDEAVPELGAHYRFRPRLYGLVPHVGAGVTGDEAFFVYFGWHRDLALGRRWLVTPSLSIAGFDKGKGKDLGLALEFRSGLDLSWRHRRGSRIGLGFYHLSNASLSEVNPGANSLLLTYVARR